MPAPEKTRIITIDGPAGSGKSTMAKRLAQRYGLAYLDTGAMFRAAALSLGAEAERLEEEALESRVESLRFSLHGAGTQTSLAVDGRPVDDSIRTEEAAMLASCLATRPAVRRALKKAQQALGRQTSLVAEGRDMGSEVFPRAGVKFFLEATPEVRAERRWRQLKDMGREADLEALTLQIRRRDDQDRNRSAAPLRPAEDAIRLDTTALSEDEVLAAMEEVLGPAEASEQDG